MRLLQPTRRTHAVLTLTILALLISGATATEFVGRERSLPKHILLVGLDGLDVRPYKAAMDQERVHGIDSNEWVREAPKVVSIDGPCTYFPNIFTLLRHAHPSSTLAAFYNWPTITQMLQPATYLNTSILTRTDTESVHLATSYIKSHLPLLTFVYFGEIDDTAHAYGFGKEYNSKLEQTDSLVGDLLKAYEEGGVLGETLVMVVTDHGREGEKGFEHGSFTQTEIETMWMVWGGSSSLGVRSNYSIAGGVENMQTASTILEALGVGPPPLQWRAHSVREVFVDSLVPDFDTVPHHITKYPKQKHTKPWIYHEPLNPSQTCLSKFRLVHPPPTLLSKIWDLAIHGDQAFKPLDQPSFWLGVM
ncbi:hypothetical protein HK102_014147, partial [Quaeritorhiza haematococci]